MKPYFITDKRGLATFKILIIVAVVVVALTVTFSCLGALVFNRFSKGVLPTDEDLAKLKKEYGAYDRVVIFGVDGAGGYFAEMETPNFDRVFKNGSVTYTALSQFPTISAQNWGSMIHGVRCSKHKLTNDKASNFDYSDTKYPSFFKVYSECNENAVMYSICDWTAINKGIIEKNIKGMKTMNAGDYYEGDEGEIGVDKMVAQLAVNVLEEGKDPDILFMHFDAVDGAGHSTGYGTPEFIAAMKNADDCIGKVYDAYCDKGWQDSTLFICIADHGHEKHGGHGSNNKTVRLVTCAVAGGLGNVINGTPGKVVTQDIASIVMYALGEKQHENWESRVPENMFKM